MLLKSRISNLEMHSEEWKQERIGRLFTSSNFWRLMGKKGLGETGLSWIKKKVFESISGTSADKEIDTDSVRHGLVYEPFNLRAFAEIKGIKYLITQKLIYGEDKNEASTPDGLIVVRENSDGLSYEVATVEAKCYQQENHLSCAMCETPVEIKEEDGPAYWQVLHHLSTVDCLKGYLSYFHPDLPLDKGGIRIIEFRKALLTADIKLMKERKELALAEFDRIKAKLLTPST